MHFRREKGKNKSQIGMNRKETKSRERKTKDKQRERIWRGGFLRSSPWKKRACTKVSTMSQVEGEGSVIYNGQKYPARNRTLVRV